MTNIDIKKMAENGWDFDRNTWKNDEYCIYFTKNGELESYSDVDLDDAIAELWVAESDWLDAVYTKEDIREDYDGFVCVQSGSYYKEVEWVSNEDLYDRLPTKEEFIDNLELDDEEKENFIQIVEESGLFNAIDEYGINVEDEGYIVYASVSYEDIPTTDKYNANLDRYLQILEDLSYSDDPGFGEDTISDFLEEIVKDDSDVRNTFLNFIEENTDTYFDTTENVGPLLNSERA